MMDQSQALSGFAALSQENRLEILRLLVRAGPDGLGAGEIADAVGVTASNFSFHVRALEHAGLVAARRESRSIIYTADYEALRGLVDFLMKDCCAGHPKICGTAKARKRVPA